MQAFEMGGVALVMASVAHHTTNWTLLLGIVGSAAATISAIGVVVVGIHWWRKRHERTARALREAQLTTDIAEMSEAVEEVGNVVTALAEEARGRAPRVEVAFRFRGGEVTPGLVVTKPPIPVVDIEAIVEDERVAALATMPRRPAPATTDELQTIQEKLSQQRRRLNVSELAQQYSEAAAAREKFLPVTDADLRAFERTVEGYAKSLRTFIKAWSEYLEQERLAVTLWIQIDNDGGAPAEDARVRLHFPDPCERGDRPRKPERPKRPKFEPEQNPLFPGNRFLLPQLQVPTLDIPRVKPPNLTGPFYEDGSVRVKYEYRSIPHHDPVKPEPFVISVPEPGRYTVHWSVGAKNLPRPAEGVLLLEVRHDSTPEEPIRTLRDLLAAMRKAG